MIPKFRAWLKQYKEMVDEVNDMTFFEGNLEFIGCRTANGVSFQYCADDIILMQSTGLHDKNGKEIFEGDILAIETDEGILNVNIFWDSKHALFMFESKKYNEKDLLAELVEDNTYPFEIAGNIYENPELLEVKG